MFVGGPYTASIVLSILQGLYGIMDGGYITLSLSSVDVIIRKLYIHFYSNYFLMILMVFYMNIGHWRIIGHILCWHESTWIWQIRIAKTIKETLWSDVFMMCWLKQVRKLKKIKAWIIIGLENLMYLTIFLLV